MRRILCGVLLMGSISAWAEQAEATAESVFEAWTAEGVIIKTDAEEGKPALVVLAQEGFGRVNGYFPLRLTAKSGVPSILRVYTHKTFGCSRELILPQLDRETVLPLTGVVEFPIPPMEKGSRLDGVCSMGQYSFEITFD